MVLELICIKLILSVERKEKLIFFLGGGECVMREKTISFLTKTGIGICLFCVLHEVLRLRFLLKLRSQCFIPPLYSAI